MVCCVLVLLAYCYAYWRMVSPLSAGCLLEVPVRDASEPILEVPVRDASEPILVVVPVDA